MAIFIALIFQVLFVLFAMSINVGLVVHDKVNLQNSVDIAAYYGAQKQAELLNAIAHQNYQVRQAWKLTSWRMNVLGALGDNNHPFRQSSSIATVANQPDAPYKGNVQSPPTPSTYNFVCTMTQGRPSSRGACSAANPCIWADAAPDDNYCQRPNFTIRNIPPLRTVSISPLTAALDALVASQVNNLRREVARSCDAQGAINWYLGAKWLNGYRMFQKNHMQLIRAMATNMTLPDFRTLEGQDVSVGVAKTFSKNLTPANLQGASVEMMNSVNGISPQSWMANIPVWISFFYMDLLTGSGAGGNSCRGVIKASWDQPARLNQLSQAVNAAEQGHANTILLPAMTSINPNGWDYGNFENYSIGVEKNPWVSVYFGVKAESAPQEIFSPFSVGVPMVARGFAKPFGGRIGPWYMHTWPQGATRSEGNPVDPNLPERPNFTGSLSQVVIPNYSRYPGDPLGLNSRLAQVSLLAATTPNADRRHYVNVDRVSGGRFYDLVAAPMAGIGSRMRSIETAAIVPDMFDITYYSIQPQYSITTRSQIEANRTALGIPTDISISGDHGGPWDATKDGYTVLNQMDVFQQLRSEAPPGVNPNAYHFVQQQWSVLTGWVNQEYNNNGTDIVSGSAYQIPSSRFGVCPSNATDATWRAQYRTPLGCYAGGRSGYSVKLVSKDFLDSGDHRNGGQGVPPGRIVNPPSSGTWTDVN